MNNTTKTVSLKTPEFESWFKENQRRIEVDQLRTFPMPKLSVRDGHRYLIITRDGSAHAFIDKTNGDILKPATYRAPAKHARGNIFADDNGMNCMGPYGPCYLTGHSYKFDLGDSKEKKELSN